MKSIKRLIKQYFYPEKKKFIISVLLNLLYSLFSVVSVVSLMPVLDMLFGGGKKQNDIISQLENEAATGFFPKLKFQLYSLLQDYITNLGQAKFLAYLCVFTVITFFFRNVFRFFAQYCIVVLKANASRAIKTSLYNKILNLPVSFFSDSRKGDVMLRMSSDVTEVENNTINSLSEIFRTPFAILFTIISLFLINAKLTIFALLVLPVMGGVIGAIGKSLKKDARKGLKESSKILSQVDETITGIKVVKVFNAEKTLSQRFSDMLNNIRSLYIKMSYKYELASPTSEFLGSIALVFITWYGGILILNNQGLDPSSFLVYLGLFFQLLEPVKSMSSAISNLQKSEANAERIVELLDEEETIKEIDNPISIKDINKNIELKNLYFSYNDKDLVLQNINLTIEAGQTVAIVGQSGSGKSTLANLLTRFYDINQGCIEIDGVDIKNLKLKEYRKLIGVVTQESLLFNDTIENNIKLGKPEASREEVFQAAHIANAMEFVEKLPEGMDTIIGEGGNKLSGGQKQRVAIARAVLKNPPFMILDEATSALDTQSERLVQDALESLMSNRTSVVIAHRLSTIVNANKIVVMDSGKIIEEGTHKELLAKGGVYKNLIDMQQFS